jgi:hypothetical protein
MLSYEHRHLVSTVQYLVAPDQPVTAVRTFDRNGWSVFVEPRQGPTGWAGIARFDSFDPDAVADDSHWRSIVGGAYWMLYSALRLGFVATNEQVHYDPGAARPTENRLLFQTQVEF